MMLNPLPRNSAGGVGITLNLQALHRCYRKASIPMEIRMPAAAGIEPGFTRVHDFPKIAPPAFIPLFPSAERMNLRNRSPNVEMTR